MKRRAEFIPVEAPEIGDSNNPLVLPGWAVTRVYLADATDEQPRRYIIDAEYMVRPEHCIYCGTIHNLHSHGPADERVRYADAPLHGRPIEIAVLKKSFRCQIDGCRRTFKQTLPHMEPGKMMTQRCADIIAEWTVDWTYADIARQVNLDESVVRRIKNEEDRAFETSYDPYAPIALGIDELTIGGERRLILTDLAHRKVIDLLEDMEGRTLANWLARLPNRHRIRLVVSDMHVGYHNVVGAMLPEAMLIMDKWHVQKGIQEKLNDIRNHGLREENDAKKAAKAAAIAAGEPVKAKPRAVPRKRGDPRPAQSPWKAKRLLATHFENITSPKTLLALDGILKNYPLLKDAHETKERFYAIWKADDREDAEARFEAWASSIPASVELEFSVVAATIRVLQEPVFAYFDHRYTAGYTECANGIIKIANRNGRGYRLSSIRRKAIMTPRRAEDRPGICERCLKPIADLRNEDSYLATTSIMDPPADFIVCTPCVDEVYEQLVRLHAGEMTAQEMRSVQAVLGTVRREVEAAIALADAGRTDS